MVGSKEESKRNEGGMTNSLHLIILPAIIHDCRINYID